MWYITYKYKFLNNNNVSISGKRVYITYIMYNKLFVEIILKQK